MNAIDRAVIDSIDRVTEKLLGDRIKDLFERTIPKKVEDAICQHVATFVVGNLDQQLGILITPIVAQLKDLNSTVKESLKKADKDIKTKIEAAVTAIDLEATPDPAYKERLSKTLADLVLKVACANDSRTGQNILVPIIKEKVLKKVQEMKLE